MRKLTGDASLEPCHLDKGVYGLDAPQVIIEKVTAKMKEEETPVNAILMNGDFVTHGIASKINATDDDLLKTWNTQKKIIA